MEQTAITTSPADCPENCGIIARVKDGRVIKLEGSPEHGYTKGFLCRKGYRSRIVFTVVRGYCFHRKRSKVDGNGSVGMRHLMPLRRKSTNTRPDFQLWKYRSIL
ncbi:MAG: hypothetical protein JSW12_07855 [Deltaproteobacteria bacterium]|nr:MAG: hypothetical protein JSW12_07855 [Deltaproteobacteria bacterium]